MTAELAVVEALAPRRMRPDDRQDRRTSVLLHVLDGGALPPASGDPRVPVAGVALATLHEHATCRDVDPATSEAMVEASTQRDGLALAAELCARCPVARLCLSLGRATAASGLWGGAVLRAGQLAPRGDYLPVVGGLPPLREQVGEDLPVTVDRQPEPEPEPEPLKPERPTWHGATAAARAEKVRIIAGGIVALVDGAEGRWSGTADALLDALRDAGDVPLGALPGSYGALGRYLRGPLPEALRAKGIGLDRPLNVRAQPLVLLYRLEEPEATAARENLDTATPLVTGQGQDLDAPAPLATRQSESAHAATSLATRAGESAYAATSLATARRRGGQRWQPRRLTRARRHRGRGARS